MLLRILRSGHADIFEVLSYIASTLLVIFLVLPFHEWAHGFTAYKLGDRTAKNMGRLSLNPMAHIDYIGAALLLIIGFGWAKPVPINPRNFKNPKAGMAITALAGPLANFVAAIVSGLCYNGIFTLLYVNGGISLNAVGTVVYEPAVMKYVLYFFWYLMLINVCLAVFNLVPVPPLDGSKILAGQLPNNLAYKYLQAEKYVRIVFLVIIIATWIPFKIGPFNDLGDLVFYPITALRDLLSDGMTWLAYKIFFII